MRSGLTRMRKNAELDDLLNEKQVVYAVYKNSESSLMKLVLY